MCVTAQKEETENLLLWSANKLKEKKTIYIGNIVNTKIPSIIFTNNNKKDTLETLLILKYHVFTNKNKIKNIFVSICIEFQFNPWPYEIVGMPCRVIVLPGIFPGQWELLGSVHHLSKDDMVTTAKHNPWPDLFSGKIVE